MSAAKHTPGPWAVDAEEIEQGADDIFTVAIWAPGPDGERPLIATVSAFSLISEQVGSTEVVTTGAPAVDLLEQAKANARLIAAAPELLEALRKLLAMADSHNIGGASRTQARAVIQKATGGQS